MNNKLEVVFIHGWGLNSAIWQNYVDKLVLHFSEKTDYQINVQLIDLLGYGQQADKQSSTDLAVLAEACLAAAPEQAIWVGWSLGGMVAMQAAMMDATNNTNRIKALQLINTTPCFVQKPDWPCGVELSVFQPFCDALSTDYESALSSFLLLQAGASKGARDLARQAHTAINQYPQPRAETLQAGMSCLANSDLRPQLSKIKVATQIVSGSLDRVTNSDSSARLAEMLKAEHVKLKTGHAPFLTEQEKMIYLFELFINRVVT